MNQNLPASESKHIPVLDFELFPSKTRISLEQCDNSLDSKSTGRTLWLGSQVLAVYLNYVLKSEKVYNKRSCGRKRKCIIELGSGIGMLSLSMLHLGYNVIATDVDFITEGILQRNVERNYDSRVIYGGTDIEGDGGASIKVKCLDWLKPIDYAATGLDLEFENSTTPSQFGPPFDYILTTDSIYHPSLISPLLKTLRSLYSKTSIIYLALENRDPVLIQSFFEQALEMGFKYSRVNQQRLEKIMEAEYDRDGEKATLGWNLDDWDGVEVYKMSYRGR